MCLSVVGKELQPCFGNMRCCLWQQRHCETHGSVSWTLSNLYPRLRRETSCTVIPPTRSPITTTGLSATTSGTFHGKIRNGLPEVATLLLNVVHLYSSAMHTTNRYWNSIHRRTISPSAE